MNSAAPPGAINACLGAVAEDRTGNARAAAVIGAVSFVTVLSVGAKVLADPDTYWHIAAGRWMIAHEAIPTADPFSNSVAGTPWVTHEWLSEVVLAAIYRYSGWTGIILLTALLAGAAVAFFVYFVMKWIEPLYAIVVAAMAFMLMAPHLLARPHMLAMPMMVAFVGGLVVARERRESPNPWLLLVMLIWANLHGGFLAGIGLAGFFAVEALVEEGWSQGLRWFSFLALAVCAGLLTPNGANAWLLLEKLSGTIGGQIIEWRSPDFQTMQPIEMWLLGFLALCLLLGIRIRATRVILLVGLLHLALQHVRNAELVGFVAPLAVLPSIAPQFYLALKRGYAELSIPTQVMTGATAATLLAVSGFLMLDHHRQDEAISPVAAVAAARSMGVKGPVFNSYAFGGYLIFVGIPPFIDGRADMYGEAFLGRYARAEAGEGLPELLAEYKFGWTITEPGLAASRALAHLSDWRKIYSDQFAVVYVRESSG